MYRIATLAILAFLIYSVDITQWKRIYRLGTVAHSFIPNLEEHEAEDWVCEVMKIATG